MKKVDREFNEDILEKAGLVSQSENKTRYYDRFRNRLMFPIFDLTGRVVGFGGRSLSEDEDEPKYMNSPETTLFQKGSLLYGLNFANRTILEKNKALIVEGYTDFVRCHQEGLTNVISPCGTSLSEEQISMIIRRYPEAEFIVCFDGDKAGQNAASRASAKMLGRGNTKVCLLPEGHDPASLYEHGERLEPYLEKSVYSLDFLVDHLAKEKGLDISKPEGILALLSVMKDDVKAAPQASHGLICDFLAKKLYVRTESIEAIVLGKKPKEATETRAVQADWKRNWETRFVRQLLADGKPETILYFVDQKNILKYLSAEARALVLYLKEAKRYFNIAQDSLFQTSKEIVNTLVGKSFEEEIVLSEARLYEFFEPMPEEKTAMKNHKDKVIDLKKYQKPNLQDMEMSLWMLKFLYISSRMPSTLSRSRIHRKIGRWLKDGVEMVEMKQSKRK